MANKTVVRNAAYTRKRKHSDRRILLDVLEFHSINRLNKLIVGLVATLIFIQYIIQLLFVITINEKVLNGWIINYSVFENFSFIPFNSLYMIFIGLEETDEGLNLDLRLKSPFISKAKESLLKKYFVVNNELLQEGA